MSRIELAYGPAPKYFLEKDATPEQLFEYVQQFYEKFANAIPSTYSIGQINGKQEEVFVTSYGGARGYYLGFYRIPHELLREYDVYPDSVELLFPLQERISQKTPGEHAFFITTHLREAGVISLGQNDLPETSTPKQLRDF